MESRFFEPPRETKIGLQNRRVREIGGKVTVFKWGEGTTFGSSDREVRKIEASRNRDSTELCTGLSKLQPCFKFALVLHEKYTPFWSTRIKCIIRRVNSYAQATLDHAFSDLIGFKPLAINLIGTHGIILSIDVYTWITLLLTHGLQNQFLDRVLDIK